jgi:phospholipase C
MLNYFSTYYKIRKSVPISGWYADIQNERTLPSVIFIDRKGDGGADEHPNTNIQTGATTVKQIFDALFQSPSWATSIVIWGFDEPGGLYEHVVPPVAVAPDNIQPMLNATDWKAGFNQYGYRVPMMFISPWTKAHFVSHTVRDHTSILKLIETRFGISPLTARDAAADDMTEFLDFTAPQWLIPPTTLAQPTNGICKYSMEKAPGH